MLLRCYRDGTDPKTAEGWLPTGDLGEWLDNGRLHVAGRRGDLIITGGENVWPEAVESILRTLTRTWPMCWCAVRSDAEWGQRMWRRSSCRPTGAVPTLEHPA